MLITPVPAGRGCTLVLQREGHMHSAGPVPAASFCFFFFLENSVIIANILGRLG